MSRYTDYSQGDTPSGSEFYEIPLLDVPRFLTCSLASCIRPAVRNRGCPICILNLCAIHILPQHHRCPSINLLDNAAWEATIGNEVKELLSEVNVPELVRVASTHRGGISCQFQPGTHLGDGSMMGCANYHCWIIFDDGIKWIVRIPRTASFDDVPQDLVDYLVASEYATLKFLEKIDTPTPKAYGFGLSSDPKNLVGEVMPGQSFYVNEATDEQKSHVYSQYADFLIHISHFPATQACSLHPDGEKTMESAIASNRFASLGKYGPFSDPIDYFSSIADLHLDLIADGQLYPEYPKEAFLFFRLLKDRAAPVLAAASTSTSGFFLKHVDDKGDHILIDENYNITGIIDWQFARFVPACEAFGPSLITADLGKLYSGLLGLSTGDKNVAELLKQKGREDLAQYAVGSELAKRFHFGLTVGLSKNEAMGMIGAVLSLLDVEISDKGITGWVESEWDQAVSDSRCAKIEKLMGDLEREGLESKK
ncbi:hypothetical protein F4821DRAFT_277812 [Hypoxylon rubiginosum]|uniref:Uncharacterized protein n=1 Tax=Hypoxylon rubiginosum TaxID=110542 RepID=A0ACC0D3V5_9PEZI|nr:hypothetical protein F4821DRAFT_277812 [Hypoxylon rubiginosum]